MTDTAPPSPLPAPPHRPSIRRLSPGRLATHARELGRTPAVWQSHVRFTQPERYWFRLEQSAEHEVWLLTWLPGQGTEIHGHGGSAGAFTVVRGELTERTYQPGAPVGDRGGRRLPPGDLRSFGPRHVHEVVNEGAEPAVSVHVYSPSLSTMTYYAAGPDGLLAPVRTEGTDQR